MATCPDDNDMACYIDGLLPVGEIQQLEKHFIECERCREIVAITRCIIRFHRKIRKESIGLL